MNFYIYGPPGCGKTTVGMLLAERMGWHFLDTDKIIEHEAGMPITEIFLQKGEAEFRSREKELLKKLSKSTRTVVALGGGTLVDPENRDQVEQDGPVVCLMCEPEVILKRMGDELNARPLLAGPGPLERLKSLLAKRAALYASFPMTLDTTTLALEDVVRKIQLVAGIFHVNAMGAGYDVLIGRGILPRLGMELEERKLSPPFVAVSDSNVAPLYLDTVCRALAPESVELIVLPAGESTKSLPTLESVYADLHRLRMERRGTVLALGGGVVTDLAGFAAATFLRGVSWVALSTSLLGMVDAAIGGKTAVDMPQGKNLIGAFYPPAMVIEDLDVLATLPPQELRVGMAEAIKTAVVGDSKLLGKIESLSGRITPDGLDWIVRRAARVKIRVVEEDPFERRGPREALNFGHTLGHGIEANSDYRIPHGEAVALGMVAESHLAEKIGLAETDLGERLTVLLTTFGLPVKHDAPVDKILEYVRADKKRRGGRVKWALPIAAGKVRVGLDVAEEDVRTALISIGCRG
ncbi:MAG: 3-dehydroquinate synthase [Anaerolineales bacterium]|nr:3-dehydroquinate synthase [Anaerolineales bacterium]